MKTAIVSGGSSGIGAALCARLQQQGWHVVSLSRRAPALAGVEHVAIDLAAPAWPEPALARLPAQAGGPLALVHNAGAFAHDSAANMDEDYLAHAFRLMVMAPARLNKLLAPMLLPGSSIVYVGSTLSAIAVPHACSYTHAQTCRGRHDAGHAAGFFRARRAQLLHLPWLHCHADVAGQQEHGPIVAGAAGIVRTPAGGR